MNIFVQLAINGWKWRIKNWRLVLSSYYRWIKNRRMIKYLRDLRRKDSQRVEE